MHNFMKVTKVILENCRISRYLLGTFRVAGTRCWRLSLNKSDKNPSCHGSDMTDLQRTNDKWIWQS